MEPTGSSKFNFAIRIRIVGKFFEIQKSKVEDREKFKMQKQFDSAREKFEKFEKFSSENWEVTQNSKSVEVTNSSD